MDYGPANIAMGTSLEKAEDINMSLTGLCVRMNDKVQRLLHLIVKQRKTLRMNQLWIASMISQCMGL